jgi:hypothetical protein
VGGCTHPTLSKYVGLSRASNYWSIVIAFYAEELPSCCDVLSLQ